ncbi:MAG TPA: ATP-dependent sacrificial sulfur transferase LarE [Candidatus Aminicenantes bacterium]|nr:ATP-dependent sacrificial sulfur transferase LarE [Candidatus Aminicenantes bacterium]
MKLDDKLWQKYERLKKIIESLEGVVIGFSGGVDSTFLLKAAHDVLGDKVLAVIATSETYPQREIEDALKLAQELGVRFKLIKTHELQDDNFRQNPPQRCYYCKKELFTKLKTIAQEKGFKWVLDGSNYDDLDDFRPGTKARDELGVRSPLQEAKLTKKDIRLLSKYFGLSTWSKPSFACLASRFPYYTPIDEEDLQRIGQAEDFLRGLGFRQVRVRHHGFLARIEVLLEEIPRLVEQKEMVVKKFKALGYRYVTIDLEGYRSGSMNEVLESLEF